LIRLYNRGILQLRDGRASVSHLSSDEIIRRGTECLACEYECWQRGNNAIYIDVPVKGLDDYRRKRNME